MHIVQLRGDRGFGWGGGTGEGEQTDSKCTSNEESAGPSPLLQVACEDGGEGALRDDVRTKHKNALSKECSDCHPLPTASPPYPLRSAARGGHGRCAVLGLYLLRLSLLLVRDPEGLKTRGELSPALNVAVMFGTPVPPGRVLAVEREECDYCRLGVFERKL